MTPLDETRAELGESPVWSAAEGALYWLDCTAPALFRHAGGETRRWRLPFGHVGAFALRAGGGFVAATDRGFAFLELAESEARAQPIADPEAACTTNTFNEAACDRRGRFWAGSACADYTNPPAAPTGALYRLDPDLSWTRVLDGLFEANTLAWSPDDRTLYFGDSVAGLIWRADFDAETGTVGDRRVFHRATDGQPDGSAIDAEGALWTCYWDGWRIERRLADGTLAATIALPVQRPTCCAFGGPDLRTLYVTSAREGLDEAALAGQPLAGAVLTLPVAVPGLPEPAFAG